jgi:phosphoribosylpyrophosphate synthetase
VGLEHAYGCGVAIDAPEAIIPIRTVRNISLNPNFGGEVMVVSLGCEKLQPDRLMPPGSFPIKDDRSTGVDTVCLQDPKHVGFMSMIDAIMQEATVHLIRLNQRKRETVPASELVVGMQCGGSDALSGVTANPALGRAADLLVRAGVTRGLTMDLHTEQIQGFFYMPVDNVYTSPQLLADLQQQVWKKIAIVSPDVGGAHRARAIAKRLERDTGANVNLAIIDKRRHGKNQTQVINIIGDVKDHTCWLVDDIVDTAGTLCQAAAALRENGACSVSAYATHPVLSGPAIDNIEQSVLEELVITDSIPMTEVAKACDKIRVLSLAPCLAETLFRVQERHSVSCMFEE